MPRQHVLKHEIPVRTHSGLQADAQEPEEFEHIVSTADPRPCEVLPTYPYQPISPGIRYTTARRSTHPQSASGSLVAFTDRGGPSRQLEQLAVHWQQEDRQVAQKSSSDAKTSPKVATKASKELSSKRSSGADKSVAASDLRQTKGNAKTTPRVASEAGKELRSKQSTTREKSVAGSDLRQVKGAVKKRA